MAGRTRKKQDGERVLLVQDVDITLLRSADWNPRDITEDRLDDLKNAIMADPEFLWERPVLAMADGTVYAGNQRLQAAIQMGWGSIPAIMEDVPEAVAHERAVRDNQTWGQWNDEVLADQLRAMPEEDRSGLGFSDAHMMALLKDLPAATPPPEDTGEGTFLENKDGERGKTPEEMIDGWKAGVVRNMVLYYPVAEYERVSGILADLREMLSTETNADVVLAAVEWGYAHHCEGSEVAEPG